MKILNSTWANFEWFEDDEGRIQKGGKLDKNDTRRVDYKALSESTNSQDLYFKNKDLKSEREKLHQNIHDTLLEGKVPQKKSVCYFVVGAIGVGKTSFKEKVFKKDSDKEKNTVFINFDLIKEHLPEYKLLKEINITRASEFLQEEASKIAGKLLKRSITKQLDLICEKTLKESSSIRILGESIKKAVKKGYSVDVILVVASDEKELQKRVIKRARRTKRHVPRDVVTSSFENILPNFDLFFESLLNFSQEKSFVYRVNIYVNNSYETSQKLQRLMIFYFNLPIEDVFFKHDRKKFSKGTLVVAHEVQKRIEEDKRLKEYLSRSKYITLSIGVQKN